MFQPPRKKLHAVPVAAPAPDKQNNAQTNETTSQSAPSNLPPRKAACASCYRDRTGCHPHIRPCPRCVRLSHDCTERTRKKYGSGRLANVVPAIPIAMTYNVSPIMMAAGNGGPMSNGHLPQQPAPAAVATAASAINSHPMQVEQSNGTRTDMGMQYYNSTSMPMVHQTFPAMQAHVSHQEPYVSSVQSQGRALHNYPQHMNQHAQPHQQSHFHSHPHSYMHHHQMPIDQPPMQSMHQQQQQPTMFNMSNQAVTPRLTPHLNSKSPKPFPSDFVSPTPVHATPNNYDAEIPRASIVNGNGAVQQSIPANPRLGIDTSAPVEGPPQFVSPRNLTSPLRFNADLMDDWKRWMSDSDFPTDAQFPFPFDQTAFVDAELPGRESPFLTSDESSADDLLRAIDEFDVPPLSAVAVANQQGLNNAKTPTTSVTNTTLVPISQVKIEGAMPTAPMTSYSSAMNALRYIQSRVSSGRMTLYRARVLVAALMWSVDNQQQEDLIQAFNNVSVNDSDTHSTNDGSDISAERQREQADIKKSANAIVIQLIRMQDEQRALHQQQQPTNATSNRSSISIDPAAAPPRLSNAPSSAASTASSTSSESSHSSEWIPGQFTIQFKTSPERCIADTDGVARLILSYETIAPTANAVHRSEAEIKEMSRLVSTANKAAKGAPEPRRHRPMKRRFMSQEEEEETWIAIQEQAVKAKLISTEGDSPSSESVCSSPSPSIGTVAPAVTHTGANGKITVSTGSSFVDSICVVVNESYERLSGYSQKDVKQLCCDYGRSGFWRIVRDDYRTALYQALLEMQLMGPDCPYHTLFARVVVDCRISQTFAHVGITPTLFPDGTPKSFVVEFYPLDIPVHDVNPNVTIMPNDVVLSSTFETQSQH